MQRLNQHCLLNPSGRKIMGGSVNGEIVLNDKGESSHYPAHRAFINDTSYIKERGVICHTKI